jgi:ABC-type lipoprotein export system ATPase subunit
MEIRLKGVRKVFDGVKQAPVVAVKGANLLISPGGFILVTGRSGSGKTTLLNLAAGLTRPTAGQVLWDGLDAWGLGDARRSLWRNQEIGFVFQFPSLVPSLNALENVLLPTAFGPAPDGRKDRARELLELVGLADRAAAYPRELSAGQQQRVVIARALINRPKVLLADEPSSNLDQSTEDEIMALFDDIYTRGDTTVLMVTHARHLARRADLHIEMAAGAVHVNEMQAGLADRPSP